MDRLAPLLEWTTFMVLEIADKQRLHWVGNTAGQEIGKMI
jgi:hypothetical protein